MMFRFGYGGHIDDDDLSGDEEARERKRQRALCMENNNDDDDQILMPIPDEGSEDEDQQGFMAIPMNDSEEEKAFLEPAFQSQKEQEQREERFHFGLREMRWYVRGKNVPKSRDLRTNGLLSLISRRASRTTSINRG